MGGDRPACTQGGICHHRNTGGQSLHACTLAEISREYACGLKRKRPRATALGFRERLLIRKTRRAVVGSSARNLKCLRGQNAAPGRRPEPPSPPQRIQDVTLVSVEYPKKSGAGRGTRWMDWLGMRRPLRIWLSHPLSTASLPMLDRLGSRDNGRAPNSPAQPRATYPGSCERGSLCGTPGRAAYPVQSVRGRPLWKAHPVESVSSPTMVISNCIPGAGCCSRGRS